MKSRLLTIFLAAIMPLQISAQTARELLKENPDRSANVHHYYEAPEKVIDTPAPKGYTPFYVSHFGRHGSRYHTSIKNFKKVNEALESLHNQGLLSARGEEIKSYMTMLTAEHADIDGILTQRGSKEHQGISQRLYERCPAIFSQKDRKDVMLASTPVQRCIQSMANFGTQLKGNAPDLSLSYYTGERYRKYLMHSSGSPVNRQARDMRMDSVSRANIHPERFVSEVFTDTDAAHKVIAGIYGDNPESAFMCDVFRTGAIGQCLDIDDPGITRFFTEDELYGLWVYDNAGAYDGYTVTLENSGEREIVGQSILQDMLEKADDALKCGSTRCADLRFGHDSGIAPLLGLLQVEGYARTNIAGTETKWFGFRMIPMATNLQIIFYKSKKSDEILVKFLRNEQEERLVELDPYFGPYYKWSELRPYLESLL